MEPSEAPGSARKGDLTGIGGEREYDVSESDVSGAGVENEVAVQPGGPSCLQVEDPRTGGDRREVRGLDRAELTSLTVVVRTLLGHMESSVSRRVMRAARLARGRKTSDDGNRYGGGQDQSRQPVHAEPPLIDGPRWVTVSSVVVTIRANGTPAISLASRTFSALAASNRQKHDSSDGT